MVSFAKRRFQVFVSSTYTDLRQERQAAVEAILSAGHIPAGMELFAAGDESQMEVIRQWIDESDIYLLILGGRYGSIEPVSGKSYIQLEYEYAIQQKKPLFSCVISDRGLDLRLKRMGKDATDAHGEKLEEFRALVVSKMVRFWDDYKDIKIAIGETLFQLSRREDIGGWVRQNVEANLPALADEIARLSKENAYLRSLSDTVNAEEKISGLTFAEMKHILESEGLLPFLTSNLDPLSQGSLIWSPHVEGNAAGLVRTGVVDAREIGGYKHYGLTEAGRVFANKLRYEQVKAEKRSQ